MRCNKGKQKKSLEKQLKQPFAKTAKQATNSALICQTKAWNQKNNSKGGRATTKAAINRN